jgi:serine phosphatase RsbU (regulator of sigma subunit)
VVDDTEHVRSVLVTQLRHLGHSATAAADGELGLAELRRELPDLVLCDMRMPNMDGLEFMRVVRDEFPGLPVIVMSGAGLLGDAIGALKLGAWDYIAKPIEGIEVLDHAVSKALEKARLLEENKRYRVHLEQLNRELESALRLLAEDEDAGRQIQFRMLPKNHQRFGEFEFSRELVPSTFLSGDFIDAFVIDDKRWGFYLADVAGHGVSSALVTVLLRTFVQRQVASYVRSGDTLVLSPSRLLARLNEEMSREALDKHLTIFYGVIDLVEDSLEYANAGHFPWPLLFDGERHWELAVPGVPVGLMPRSEYAQHRIQLPKHVVLAAFSDGVLEVLNQQSLEQKLTFLRSLFARSDITVEQVRKALDLDGPRQLPDDVAYLLIKRGECHE